MHSSLNYQAICVYSGSVGIEASPANGAPIVSSIAPAGVWNHTAVTITPTALTVWANGQRLIQVSGGALGSSANQMLIGAPSPAVHANDAYFDGKLGDVRLYDRALTPSEVASTYYDKWSLYRTPEPVLAGAPAGGFFQFDQLTGGMPDLRGGMV
jgi:hypothetical protein